MTSASGRVVELRSGGHVVLSLAVDLFMLSEADRDFVFGLVDKVRQYGETVAIPNDSYESPPIYLEQPAVQVSEMRTVDAPAPAQELSNAETLQAPAPTPVKAKQSQAWTPEKRAAESERAKQRWADRRAVHGPPEQVAEEVPPFVSAQVESATTEPAPAPPVHEGVHPENEGVPPAAATTEPLPFCQCPAAWWATSAVWKGEPLTPSAEHNHLCPLHRHKWRLPPAAGLDGQTHIGRCACGATKEHGFAPAAGGFGNAAQRAKGQHTAAVQA